MENDNFDKRTDTNASNVHDTESNTVKTENPPPVENKAIEGRKAGIKLNKYTVSAVLILVAVLTVYLFYSFNIAGSGFLLRNIMGYVTGVPSSAGLDTLVASAFPNMNALNLSASVAARIGLNSSNVEGYKLFGAGESARALENGSSSFFGFPGSLLLFLKGHTNESLGFYYTQVGKTPNASLSNLTINGNPAFKMVLILNLAPTNLSAEHLLYGTLNVTAYYCGKNGFNLTLKNMRNKTISLKSANISSIANLSLKNSSVFSYSPKSVKPNGTLSLIFPQEKCNSTFPYETLVDIKTNSTHSLSVSSVVIRFSPYITVFNSMESILVQSVENGSLYQISGLFSGKNYTAGVNSSFDSLLNGLHLRNFG